LLRQGPELRRDLSILGDADQRLTGSCAPCAPQELISSGPIPPQDT
jgi:hypothetical protein